MAPLPLFKICACDKAAGTPAQSNPLGWEKGRSRLIAYEWGEEEDYNSGKDGSPQAGQEGMIDS